MKFFQRIVVILIIFAPVLIGFILLVHNKQNPSTLDRIGLKKLGVVRVEGVIVESESIVKKLQTMLDDKTIAGVLLRINSPGGATVPAQEIYEAVSKYRKKGKPLIVSMGNIAASGGYYIASPAKRIFAEGGTLTGSIGVIMTVPLYKELAKKIGIEIQTFKAGDYKDIASPYREVSQKERVMIQRLLEDTHNQFIDDVAKARSIERDSLLPIADGRIFTGRQALKEKLIDTIGSYEDALAYLRIISGVGVNARIIDKMEVPTRFIDWFIGESVRLFPQLYRILAPIGMQCIFTLSE